MLKSLILVHTGHGKGKSTAAFGLALRAMGHGMRVCLVQFLKGRWKTGEQRIAAELDLLEFHAMGKGFTWKSENLDEDIRVAHEAWTFAREKIASDQYGMVILDELTYLIKYKMITEQEVLDALRNRPERLHIVITGRDASPGLIEIADLVSEVNVVKHPLKAGVKAQKGIEF